MGKRTNKLDTHDTAPKTTSVGEPIQRRTQARVKPDVQAERMLSLGVVAPTSARPIRQPATPVMLIPSSAPTRLEASFITGGHPARRTPAVTPGAQSSLPIAPKRWHETTSQQVNTTPRVKGAGLGVRRRLAELRGLLAEGWEIVQPIFARPLWTSPDDTATAFNFVLSRAQATRLVTVPDAASVARFIRARQLNVDMR